MQQVDFYLIENPVNNARFKLASRLAKKLQGLQQSTLLMVEDEEQLAVLDETLWTFSDTSFVAHDRFPVSDKRHCQTHLITKQDVARLTDANYDVLISMTDQVPELASRFSRIAEIIEADDDARKSGRERFKRYRDRGFELKTHKLEM